MARTRCVHSTHDSFRCGASSPARMPPRLRSESVRVEPRPRPVPPHAEFVIGQQPHRLAPADRSHQLRTRRAAADTVSAAA